MSSRAVDRSTDSAHGLRLNAATFLRGITTLVLFVTAVLVVRGTTAADAPTYAYDAPAVASVDAGPFTPTEASPTQLGGSREESASLSVGARGTVTTFPTRNIATEAAGELPPAVIGEGMSSRVVPYAEQNGYVTYPGIENPANYTYDELLAHNRAQIETWKGEGRTIIDVGPEPGRAYYPMETSPNYGMEHNIVRGYPGYQPTVLPGESNWMLSHVR